jgi:hypothetical protein
MGVRERKKGKGNPSFVFNSLGEYGNKSTYIELPSNNIQAIHVYLGIYSFIIKVLTTAVTLLHSPRHQRICET